jgi:hypothetical protein
MQSPLFFLGVIPVLAAPALGFKVAYSRACLEIRRALDDLLDAVEESQPQEEETQDRGDRPPGQIQGLKPIPRFAPNRSKRKKP